MASNFFNNQEHYLFSYTEIKAETVKPEGFLIHPSNKPIRNENAKALCEIIMYHIKEAQYKNDKNHAQ